MRSCGHGSIGPTRRGFLQLGLGLALVSSRSAAARALQGGAGEPRFVDPPGAPSADQAQRLTRLAADLAEARTTTNGVLADPAWADLRPLTAFREQIRLHAAAPEAVLVPEGEPGTPLGVRARVLDGAGAGVAGVLAYAYQTSAKGWYAAEAPHVSGTAGDERHARLFGYCRTDAEGRFGLRTVRPGGYPRSSLPQHIHVELFVTEQARLVSEIRFADDPRLGEQAREESRRLAFQIVEVAPDEQGAAWCEATFVLPAGEGR